MIKLKELIYEISNIIRENAKRPPGFQQLDTEPFEIQQENIQVELDEAELPADLVYRVVKDPESWYAHQKSLVGTGKNKQEDEPYIHPGNKEGSLKDLIADITTPPKELLSKNRKIQKSGGKLYNFYNLSLPAYRTIFFDEQDKKLKIINTCPMAGKCSKFCYAQKGGYVQFSRVGMALTQKANFLFNHWDEFKSMLLKEIESVKRRDSANGIITVIRWHDSGDFLSEKYLDLAFDIARSMPDVLHYTYTKRVAMVSGKDVPENFIFNYSFGGKEDEKIQTLKQKHADVIPRNLYTRFIKKYRDNTGVFKYKFKNGEAKRKFMDIMSQYFSINRDSIITYTELMKTPEASDKKWNVVVGPGDGDDAAMRKDVLGIYLMEH